MCSRGAACLAGVALLVCCGSTVGADEPASAAGDALAAAVELHYEAVVDLTAEVVQKNHLQALGKVQTFTARLSIKKPGRLRLDYTNGQVIVLDGTAALFYSKKSEQLIRRTFEEIAQANVPVAFLLDAARISSDFDARSAGDGRLELRPKQSGAVMDRILLAVEESGRIMAMTIHDRSGNRTEITFSDVRENAGVDDKRFRFRAPKGTEIIEQ